MTARNPKEPSGRGRQDDVVEGGASALVPVPSTTLVLSEDWTTEPPTVEGFYWMDCDALGLGPVVVEFDCHGHVWLTGNLYAVLTHPKKSADTLWCGPLAPPAALALARIAAAQSERAAERRRCLGLVQRWKEIGDFDMEGQEGHEFAVAEGIAHCAHKLLKEIGSGMTVEELDAQQAALKLARGDA